MKKFFYSIFLISIFLLIVFADNSYGEKKYKFAVIELTISDIFIKFLKDMEEATKSSFDIQVYPSARCIKKLENKEIDAFLPATISNDNKKNINPNMKFEYATALTLYYVNFVLYTNKQVPIRIKELKKGNPKNYIIETQASLMNLFEFKPVLSTNVRGSLKKVSRGRIDGFLYPLEVADGIVKNLHLKSINRDLYSCNRITYGIQKGARGTKFEKFLIIGLKKVKANGKFDQTLGKLMKQGKYIDWQP